MKQEKPLFSGENLPLRPLADGPPGLRLSVYVPVPERPGFDELRALPRLARGAVDEAASRMRELGVHPARAEGLVERLGEPAVESTGLPPATRGVAWLLGPHLLERRALLTDEAQLVSVGRSFRVRPLLRSAAADLHYRVLALGAGRVALYEGDARSLRPVARNGVPSSLEEALGSELDDSELQWHPSGTERNGYHGHGGARRERAVDRERFHRIVAGALRAHWAGRDDPLVLVADATHQGRFRKLARLPGLLPEGVESNADALDGSELMGRVLPVVRAARTARERAAVDELPAAIAHGAALERVDAIASAVAAGRVRRLWLDAERRLPVHVDPDRGNLVEAFGDEDALDELALLTARHGGDVCVVDELAHGQGAVAVLR